MALERSLRLNWEIEVGEETLYRMRWERDGSWVVVELNRRV